MKRTLTPRSEPLAELTTDELTTVVAAGVLPTTPVKECLADLVDTMQPTRCVCP